MHKVQSSREKHSVLSHEVDEMICEHVRIVIERHFKSCDQVHIFDGEVTDYKHAAVTPQYTSVTVTCKDCSLTYYSKENPTDVVPKWVRKAMEVEKHAIETGIII